MNLGDLRGEHNLNGSRLVHLSTFVWLFYGHELSFEETRKGILSARLCPLCAPLPRAWRRDLALGAGTTAAAL